MKKVLITATVQSHVAQFHKPLIKLLKSKGYEVHIAAYDNLSEKNGLELSEPDKVFNIPFKRFPLKKENLEAYKELKRIITQEKYDIVHCNTPVGGVITRLAARRMRKEGLKVFYTAHGFHFHKGASLLSWLVYYPIEKLLSYHTDVLITINKEDFARAKKKFKNCDVKYIPGVGVDLTKFYKCKNNEFSNINLIDDFISTKSGAFIILSVGELNSNKNHEVILNALSVLNNRNIYYLICGNGPLENYLKDKIVKLGLEKQVKLLGYRTDVDEIYKISDVFAFPSKREGLGLAAIEAMASGLPIITSNIRGVEDYSKNGVTGFNCSPMDEICFSKAIKTLYEDVTLRSKISNHNIKAVRQFEVSEVEAILEEIYLKES